MDLKKHIREVPDFPKKGILFYDITTLILDPEAFSETIERIYEQIKDLGITKVVGIESRGFIFGAVLALKLGKGFAPIRKPGKLPSEKYSETYDLEYGSDTVEIHADAVSKGDRVLLVDDLLATGGTMKAAVRLIEKSGASVEKIVCVIELLFLDGRKKLDGYDIISLVSYD